MRQVLCHGGGAVVARNPRPLVGPGLVVVRVEYSLISVGTELAALRSTFRSADATHIEAAARLTGTARQYLGKAWRDPRKAWARVGEIARREIRRRLPKRKRVELAAAGQPVELVFSAVGGARLTTEAEGFRVETDGSERGLQVRSNPIEVGDERIPAFEIRGRVEEGRLSIGVIDADANASLGSIVVEGDFEEQLAFDPGSARKVVLVVSNVDGPARVSVSSSRVGFATRADLERLSSDLDAQGWDVGYSAAGTVVEVGDGVPDLVPGDRVACAGAAYAHHADFIAVPRNLVVRVPDACELDEAATTTVGAIALQGVRRAAPQLGETIAVAGLGLIGQIAVRLLVANGCRVVGCDLDPARVERALEAGMLAGTGDAESMKRVVRDVTGGRGVDATLLCAASGSSALLNLGFEITRARGKVVIVGDVGLHAERANFYRKEIDLLMSTSYGPGRYDASYEEGGRDYPFAHVRWTLNRNMSAYLDQIARRRIDVRELIDRIVDVDSAPRVYAELAAGGQGLPLGVLFRYPRDEAAEAELAQPRVVLRGHRRARDGALRYALVGASAFGTAMLVPQMQKRPERFFLRGLVSRSMPSHAGNFARSQRVEVVTTDLDVVLADPEFDFVVIATRHQNHAELVARCLEAGKHVFVEKPLCLSWKELDLVASTFRRLSDPPQLLVGFNRRFSPAMQELSKALAGRTSPLMIRYRMNAGYIPLDHWVHGAEGGGRNLGEACHMYDCFRFLARAPIASIDATAIDPGERPYLRNDNFAVTLRYGDGSVATLLYTAMGPKQGVAKEHVEVFCEGEAYSIDDYRTLGRGSDGTVLWKSGSQDKGHFDELSSWGDAVALGSAPPIPVEEIFETSAVALHVEDLLHGRDPRDGG
ncbi:scyllo-inositol 2-dehydrogenase (NAD(+)) [Myxococcaceae bacterium]|jgi:predicted dehydrogenase/threonine dehydrogenase-like Zn-dependent dehydrogenase|nr:scyllo-inositol 2-dehydrogenase (NAD(+)) [Myxococcaceae bacterium]